MSQADPWLSEVTPGGHCELPLAHNSDPLTHPHYPHLFSGFACEPHGESRESCVNQRLQPRLPQV